MSVITRLRSFLGQIKKSHNIFEYCVAIYFIEKYCLLIFPIQLDSTNRGYIISKCKSKSKYITYFALIVLYASEIISELYSPLCSHHVINMTFTPFFSSLLIFSLLAVLRRHLLYKDLLDIYKVIEKTDNILLYNFGEKIDYTLYIYIAYGTGTFATVCGITYGSIMIFAKKAPIAETLFITACFPVAIFQNITNIYYMWVVFFTSTQKISFVIKKLEEYQDDELYINELTVLMKVTGLILKSVNQAMTFSSVNVLLITFYAIASSVIGIVSWNVCVHDFMIRMIIPAILFFIANIIMSEMQQNFDDAYEHLVRSIIEINHSNERIASIKKLYLLQTYHERLDGRLCGCIRIDRGFLVQLISTITTGVLFMYNLFPELLNSGED